MKLLILILLTLPQLIFAGWVKEGNGFISEDSLVGQKRFLPEENAVIVESKDYVLKFDLTTGEIIKRIDIVETDTTYKNAVANDDLSQVYLLKEKLIPNKEYYASFILVVEILNYITQKIIHTDSIPIAYDTYYYSLDLKPYFLFYRNKIFYSLDNSTYSYLGSDGKSTLRIYSTIETDTLKQILNNGGKIDSYKLLNPFGELSYFSSNYYMIRTKQSNYESYENQLLVFNNIFNKVNSIKTRYESTQFTNMVIGKTPENFIYGYGGKLVLNGEYGAVSKNLKYGENTPISFTSNDNYLFVAYPFSDQPYQNGVSIQTIEGVVIFRDTIPMDIPRKIAFDDGNTFYFESKNKLFKYSPEFLNQNNLKAIMSEVKDTLNVAQEFYIENLSSGSPSFLFWYIDDKLVSTDSKVNYSISEIGNHKVKLVVQNSLYSDSITKNIYIRDIKVKDFKGIDFSVNLNNSNGLVARFNVKEDYKFKEFYWNFGDGLTAKGRNVSHRYIDTGTYTVTLTGIQNDGKYVQEIKNELIRSNPVEIDYSKPLFEKFELRNDDRQYFKSNITLFNVKIKVVDKFDFVLFEEYYEVLSKGEIKNIITPIDNEYRIQLETKSGDKYEY